VGVVDDLCLGRGNLNTSFIVLIFMINICFGFWLEYQLEYLATARPQILGEASNRPSGISPYPTR
jgi:hypothetical protein